MRKFAIPLTLGLSVLGISITVARKPDVTKSLRDRVVKGAQSARRELKVVKLAAKAAVFTYRNVDRARVDALTK